MLRFVLVVPCLAFALASSVRAAGPYDDLVKYTPNHTNVLALIDVKGALASPLSIAEKWNERGQPNNRGGLGFVPRDAEVVVIAADVNLITMAREYQLGLVKVGEVPTVREIAIREGGTTDEIVGRFAVLSPRDVYFTTLSPTELVAVYPAVRQATARWLKAVQAKKTGDLSAYLKKAVEKAGENTVTIAVDLQDVADRTILKMSLPSSPAVTKVKGADINYLSMLLAGAKGMTFSALVTDKIAGSITVEFEGDPTLFRKTLPDLIRELIEGQGVAIDGFEKWEVKFTATTITLSGVLTTADLKRIVSLFAFPNPAGEPDPMVKGNEPSLGMTKRYFTAVDMVLRDVSELKKSPNYEKTATWHEKAAAQIEQLSRRNVDPLAVDAAIQTAKRLRAIGGSLRGAPIEVNALANQQYYVTTPSVGLSHSWFGWKPFITGVNTETNIPKIQAEISKVIAADQQRRDGAWSDIGRIMTETAKKLTEKYKSPF